MTEQSGSSPDVPFGVAMDGESVYATYPQGGVVKHDAQSGDVQAQRNTGGQPTGPPAIVGEQVVVPEDGFALAAYGTTDGTPTQGSGLRWTVQGSHLTQVGVDVGDLRVGRSLTVDGESVVFAATDGTDGVVAAVDDRGQPQAATKVELADPTPAGPPVVTNGLVVVAFGSQLVVLDRNDLSTLHSDLLDEQPVGPPTRHAGRVLLPTSTGIAAYDVTRDLELAQDIQLFEYQLTAAGGALRRPVTVETILGEVTGFDGGLVTEQEVQRVVDEADTTSEDEADRIGPDDTSQSVTVDGGLDPLEPVTVYLLIEATVELRASVDDATEARLRATEVLSLSAVTEEYEQARVAAIEEYKRENDDDDSDGDGAGGNSDGSDGTDGAGGNSDTGTATDDGSSDGNTELWPFGVGALGAAGGYAGYRYVSGKGSDGGDASDGPADEE